MVILLEALMAEQSFGLYSNVTNADGTDAGFFINPSVIDGVNKAMYVTFDNKVF